MFGGLRLSFMRQCQFNLYVGERGDGWGREEEVG